MRGSGAFKVFELLSVHLAVLDVQGRAQYSNAALEQALGFSRRTVLDADSSQFFTDPSLLREAIVSVSRKQFGELRFEARLRRQLQECLPVHVNLSHDELQVLLVVELWPLEQHVRQGHEESNAV